MRKFVKALCATAVACTATGSFAALDPFTIPAGIGCQYPLTIQPLEEDPRTLHFTRSGMLVLSGAFGSLQYINANTGKSLTLSSKGAVFRSVDNGDGSSTNTLTGHWTLIWFPGDKPAGIGPSVIEYSGRLVYRQVGDESTLISQDGKEVRDICAALS
jgi:hypothetical protein